MSVRVFVPAGTVANGLATVTGEPVHYLTRVMRLGPGDAIVLLEGDGLAHEARITAAEKTRIEAEVVASSPVYVPPVRVTLYQALPKADKLDWILQKATELGVARIVPLAAERSVVQIEAAKVASKLERWGKIVQEAAEQCERGEVPIVEAPLKPAAVRLGEGELGVVLAERVDARGLPAVLAGEPPASLSLFVGPEGGWSPAELAAFEAAGIIPATLGPRILRAETAAVAALTLAMARYELEI